MLVNADPLADKYYLGVKVAGIGLGSVDFLNDTITLDARAASLFDLPADQPIPRSVLHDRIHPEDRPTIDCQVKALLDPSEENFIEVNHRVVHENGEIMWVSARKQVEFSDPENGSPIRAVSGLVAIIDVTAHKRDQQKVQFLLDELSHRTKNLLTVVQVIARRTFATGGAETFLERFSNRLNGLAHNQNALVSGNAVDVELETLVKSHLSGFGRIDGPRLQIEGPKVRLNSVEGQAIGMALHELATNASKYGALSNETGLVSVKWDVEPAEKPKVSITWSEMNGPEVSEPECTGFGQKVMKDMVKASLRGSVDLEYRPKGLYWHVQFEAAGW